MIGEHVEFEIGFLRIRTGDKDAAAQYLEKYLELRPDAPDAARVRGVKDALVKAAQQQTGP